ncbi:MAG: inositol monophosphatase [Clostridia bacterium]|nr:inositol monophosphatase [Clostridia bacterium]
MMSNELRLKAGDGISAETVAGIISAMRRAGELIRRAHHVESIENGIHVKPGSANFVTVYDVKVQTMLMDALHILLPQAHYFAEEKENSMDLLEKDYCFIIDPIDGTTNFIHNYCGLSAISVGLYHCGQAIFGAIYDPYRDEMFYAVHGHGAYLDEERIHVSERKPAEAVYAVGTSSYDKAELGERTMKMISALFFAGADIRRCGSAALELAYVASGRIEGFAELSLAPWDYAAGALLVKEAGGICCQPDGTPLKLLPHGAARYAVMAGTKTTIGILCKAAQP